MKNFKKALRLLALGALITLASFGIGLTGAILPGHRGRFEDKPVTVELVENKDDSEEESEGVKQ